MSAAKKKPAKKSAKASPAKPTAAKRTTKSHAAKKSAAKKPAAKKPAAKKPETLDASATAPTGTAGAALTPIEAEARKLMDADAAGDIDNVFDIVEELETVRKGLPKTSDLYPEWKRFYDDCCRIMGESVGM